MRVLFDTNVLIAAFITQGTCSDLLEHCIRRHKIVSCEFIMEEMRGHLRKKFKFSERDTLETLNILTSVVEIVIPESLQAPICRDADDDVILAAALTGHVDCVVSGDKDLTDLKIFQGIPILRPSEFSAFEAG
jgi:putative PIN family toxin of toxin-antitoxin system